MNKVKLKLSPTRSCDAVIEEVQFRELTSADPLSTDHESEQLSPPSSAQSKSHRIELRIASVLLLLQLPSMSLACLVCHSSESPSHSFRSYSVSSSENDGRCPAIANCLTMKSSLPLPPRRSAIPTSKVTPQPNMPAGITGAPRLVRSHAVRRDIVRDWNFDEVVTRMER